MYLLDTPETLTAIIIPGGRAAITQQALGSLSPSEDALRAFPGRCFSLETRLRGWCPGSSQRRPEGAVATNTNPWHLRGLC